MPAEVGQGLISEPPDRQYHAGEPCDPAKHNLTLATYLRHFKIGDMLFSFEVLEN